MGCRLSTQITVSERLVTTLDKSGFASEDIMTVTGHWNIASLQPYMGVPDIACKHSMSDALHEFSQPSVLAIEGSSRPAIGAAAMGSSSDEKGSHSDDSKAVVLSQRV